MQNRESIVFEKKIVEKVGCGYAVALSAGTAALHLARAVEIGKLTWVGAVAVVVNDVEKPGTYLGVIARKQFSSNKFVKSMF